MSQGTDDAARAERSPRGILAFGSPELALRSGPSGMGADIPRTGPSERFALAAFRDRAQERIARTTTDGWMDDRDG